MKELEQLETDKKDLKPGDETNRFNESASRFNQKVRDYELKCKAFESEVRANKAQVDVEVAPLITRKFFFETNPSGAIVKFKTDVEKSNGTLQQ